MERPGHKWFLGVALILLGMLAINAKATTSDFDGAWRDYRLGGGLVGMMPDEPLLSGAGDLLLAGRWLTASDRRVCLVPPDVAEALGIGENDLGEATVNVLGIELTVIGIFGPDNVDELKDLDGESITPVDFLSLSGERRLQGFQPLTVEQQSDRVHPFAGRIEADISAFKEHPSIAGRRPIAGSQHFQLEYVVTGDRQCARYRGSAVKTHQQPACLKRVRWRPNVYVFVDQFDPANA